MPSIVAGMRDKPKRVREYRFLVVYGLGRAA